MFVCGPFSRRLHLGQHRENHIRHGWYHYDSVDSTSSTAETPYWRRIAQKNSYERTTHSFLQWFMKNANGAVISIQIVG